MCKIFFIIILVPALLYAQTNEEVDQWWPMSFFVGSWTSTGKGCPGVSTGDRTYQFVLNRNFLLVKNTSLYQPQEGNPEGEVHEDWGFISYDGHREIFIWRQFHGEGFVNHYVLDSLATDGNSLVFVTESIENISPGWRAKLTCRILGQDEFTEVFELAAPEKEFEVYVENLFERKAEDVKEEKNAP